MPNSKIPNINGFNLWGDRATMFLELIDYWPPSDHYDMIFSFNEIRSNETAPYHNVKVYPRVPYDETLSESSKKMYNYLFGGTSYYALRDDLSEIDIEGAELYQSMPGTYLLLKMGEIKPKQNVKALKFEKE